MIKMKSVVGSGNLDDLVKACEYAARKEHKDVLFVLEPIDKYLFGRPAADERQDMVTFLKLLGEKYSSTGVSQEGAPDFNRFVAQLADADEKGLEQEVVIVKRLAWDFRERMEAYLGKLGKYSKRLKDSDRSMVVLTEELSYYLMSEGLAKEGCKGVVRNEIKTEVEGVKVHGRYEPIEPHATGVVLIGCTPEEVSLTFTQKDGALKEEDERVSIFERMINLNLAPLQDQDQTRRNVYVLEIDDLIKITEVKNVGEEGEDAKEIYRIAKREFYPEEEIHAVEELVKKMLQTVPSLGKDISKMLEKPEREAAREESDKMHPDYEERLRELNESLDTISTGKKDAFEAELNEAYSRAKSDFEAELGQMQDPEKEKFRRFLGAIAEEEEVAFEDGIEDIANRKLAEAVETKQKRAIAESCLWGKYILAAVAVVAIGAAAGYACHRHGRGNLEKAAFMIKQTEYQTIDLERALLWDETPENDEADAAKKEGRNNMNRAWYLLETAKHQRR